MLLNRDREKMFSVQTFIIAALLTELVVVVESSIGDGSSSYNYDISKKSDLTKLYNSKVHKAERVKIPLGNLGFTIGIISHTGVVVTLADGSRWLIHKGAGFGDSSQTVVVDARHMSSQWKVIKKRDFKGKKTVADFVADGGSDYSLIFNNCHHASSRMMKL